MAVEEKERRRIVMVVVVAVERVCVLAAKTAGSSTTKSSTWSWRRRASCSISSSGKEFCSKGRASRVRCDYACGGDGAEDVDEER